jgi:hypothetical protein
MSESKGNLRNRIDNNLKLSIPEVGMSAFAAKTNHPATAPAVSVKKDQFDDLSTMKNLMKKWDENGHEDYFVTTPSSIMSDTSLKRKQPRFASSSKDIETSSLPLQSVHLWRTSWKARRRRS